MLRQVLVAMVVLSACGGDPPRRRPSDDFVRGGAGTHVLSIEHVNEMGETFELVGRRVTLAGREVLATGGAEGTDPLAPRACAYRGTVIPGDQEIGVELYYRGRGHGVFSYLSGYRFVTRSTTRVPMPRGAAVVHVTITGVERGGATAPLEERPAVRFEHAMEPTDVGAGCFP